MEHVKKTLEALENRQHVIEELWRIVVDEQAEHIEKHGFENPSLKGKIDVLTQERNVLESADYWLTIAMGSLAGIE